MQIIRGKVQIISIFLETRYKYRYSYTYERSPLWIHTYTSYLYEHLWKIGPALILRFTKSVIKNVSLSKGTSTSTERIISRKYNTHFKSGIWIWEKNIFFYFFLFLLPTVLFFFLKAQQTKNCVSEMGFDEEIVYQSNSGRCWRADGGSSPVPRLQRRPWQKCRFLKKNTRTNDNIIWKLGTGSRPVGQLVTNGDLSPRSHKCLPFDSREASRRTSLV
jgi:hypothetical protein